MTSWGRGLTCCVGLWLAACHTGQLTNGSSPDLGDAGLSPDAGHGVKADHGTVEGGGEDAPVQLLDVRTSAQLKAALNSATAGTTINLLSGVYIGQFDVRVSGEDGAPVVIRGPPDRSAILDGDFSVTSWRGVLNLESVHHVTVKNLEIRNTSASRYGVLIGATSKTADGSNHIVLNNLHVHDVGEEIIKIQGRNSHDILVEKCVVHTNHAWSGIDVQGHWGGTPPYEQKPRRVIIRRNLVYDIPAFAGIGNEFADKIHVYDNVVLGSAAGLDIGCGNHNVIHNNLIASYAVFNQLKNDPGYQAIDLSRYRTFSAQEIAELSQTRCADGIALSGNYRGLVFDNEITDCTGDLLLSYDHWLDGTRHNSLYGHRENLFFRNKLHDNSAYRTIREYNKQDEGVTFEAMYFHNLFANNQSATDILFEHSQGLLFFDNTIVDGDQIGLREQSIDAVVKNNVIYASGLSVSDDSTNAKIGNNCQTDDPAVFRDLAAGDFRLNSASSNPCLGTGADLAALIGPRLQPFVDAYDSEYRYYDDFDIAFDFGLDFNGNAQGASWDAGAFFATE